VSDVDADELLELPLSVESDDPQPTADTAMHIVVTNVTSVERCKAGPPPQVCLTSDV
jgi:hypothetical protein